MPTKQSSDLQTCLEAINGAWPKGASPRVCRVERSLYIGSFCCDDEAPALFRDSGLRWLLDHGNTECLSIVSYEASPNPYAIELDEFQDRTMRNRQQMGFLRVEGPTLLSAIDAAIRATKGDQHEAD